MVYTGHMANVGSGRELRHLLKGDLDGTLREQHGHRIRSLELPTAGLPYSVAGWALALQRTQL